jgi:hypothetical protein
VVKFVGQVHADTAATRANGNHRVFQVDPGSHLRQNLTGKKKKKKYVGLVGID